MKRKMSWLFALVFSVMMMLVALPSQAMAAEVQLAQVQQPSKQATVAQFQQPSKTEAAAAAGMSAPGVAAPAPGQIGDCSLCFTCGSFWPIFGGVIPTASGAEERGSGCSGDMPTPTDDTIPYLCCN